MQRKSEKLLDVISNDSNEYVPLESAKTPDLNDYSIHTDMDVTSSDEQFNNGDDDKLSLSRASSFFRSGSKGSYKSNDNSEVNKSHHSFRGLFSGLFHKDKTKRSNSASSSLSNKGIQRGNFLNDEYDDGNGRTSRLDDFLEENSDESSISQVPFNMSSPQNMEKMTKDTPLTPITTDVKMSSQLNNYVHNTGSDNYYSTQLTNTYSKFYNFYESLNIGTLSRENNTDLDSLMRQIKITWDNNQSKVHTLEEKKLYLIEKIDSLEIENSKMQSQLEQNVQSHTKLANKYKKYVDTLNVLLETYNDETDSDQEHSRIYKTKKNQDFNKLIEIVKNGPTWRKHNIQLQQENQDLKENNRQLTTKVKNSNDQLEDQVYESLKTQFERKMDKLEECIVEHKEKSELLEKRNLETINKYKNEKTESR